MKRLLLALLFLLLCNPLFATDSIIIGGSSTLAATADTTATSYITPIGKTTSTTAANIRIFPFSPAGTLSKLYVVTNDAPGTDNNWVFTLMQNGSATSLTCTIAGAATSASDTANSVSVTAGDYFEIKVVATKGGVSNTPTTIVTTCMEFDSTTSGETMIGSAALDISTVTDQYIPIQGQGSEQTTQLQCQLVMPSSGTIKNLYGILSAAPGTGKSRVFTLYKGADAQTLTITFGAADTTKNDTANSFTVAAGDLISVYSQPVSTPAATKVYLGFTFLPDTAGQFVLGMNTNTSAFNTTSIRYTEVNTGNAVVTGTEGTVDQTTLAFTAKAIFAAISAAPGATKSYTFTLRDSGVPGDTALTKAISGATDTAGNFSTDVSIALSSLIDIEITPAGTPASATGMVSILGYIAPPTVRRVMLIQ